MIYRHHQYALNIHFPYLSSDQWSKETLTQILLTVLIRTVFRLFMQIPILAELRPDAVSNGFNSTKTYLQRTKIFRHLPTAPGGPDGQLAGWQACRLASQQAGLRPVGKPASRLVGRLGGQLRSCQAGNAAGPKARWLAGRLARRRAGRVILFLKKRRPDMKSISRSANLCLPPSSRLKSCSNQSRSGGAVQCHSLQKRSSNFSVCAFITLKGNQQIPLPTPGVRCETLMLSAFFVNRIVYMDL